MDVDSMFDGIPGFLVARRLDDSFDACTEQRNGKWFFKVDALGEIRRLAQMSLDLLGARYSPERHQRYRTRGDGSKYWDGKTIFRKPSVDLFYFFEKDCCSAAIEAARIRTIPVPYRKELNKAQHEELINKGIHLERFTEKKEYDLEGEYRLEHKPTMLNYWHFQANFYPAGEDKPMEGDNKGWRKKASDFLVQFLLVLPVYPVTMCTAPTVASKFYKELHI